MTILQEVCFHLYSSPLQAAVPSIEDLNLDKKESEVEVSHSERKVKKRKTCKLLHVKVREIKWNGVQIAEEQHTNIFIKRGFRSADWKKKIQFEELEFSSFNPVRQNCFIRSIWSLEKIKRDSELIKAAVNKSSPHRQERTCCCSALSRNRWMMALCAQLKDKTRRSADIHCKQEQSYSRLKLSTPLKKTSSFSLLFIHTWENF